LGKLVLENAAVGLDVSSSLIALFETSVIISAADTGISVIELQSMILQKLMDSEAFG